MNEVYGVLLRLASTKSSARVVYGRVGFNDGLLGELGDVGRVAARTPGGGGGNARARSNSSVRYFAVLEAAAVGAGRSSEPGAFGLNPVLLGVRVV